MIVVSRVSDSTASGRRWKNAPPIMAPVANETRTINILFRDFFEKIRVKAPLNARIPLRNVIRSIHLNVSGNIIVRRCWDI